MRQLTAVVEGSASPIPGTRLLYLHCPPLGEGGRPGQFILVRCGHGYDPYLRVPLAIHRFTDEGIALFFRPSNEALAWLAARQVGDALDLLGPCGRGFNLSPDLRSVSLIARGMGVGPLLGIVDRIACLAQLVISVPTGTNLYPRELLPRQVEYVPCVGQQEDGSWLQAVTRACQWGQRIYASGPPSLYPWLRRVLEATRLGLREGVAEVWMDVEMGCGMGACGSCEIQTRHGWKHACSDGPTFDLASLRW